LLKPSALIYRHYDGYPSGHYGVMEVLVPWARAFDRARGLNHAEYAAARALYALMNATAPDGNTGYGISNDFHGDLSFYYRVDPKQISVYRYDARGTLLFSVKIKDESAILHNGRPRDARGRFVSLRVGARVR
jgi:hypothetical protein